MKKLNVIYYHDIVDCGKGYRYQKVEEANFEAQMQYLKQNEYHSICFEDLCKPLPEKAVLITFDDGFRSVYERAIPIMRKYGIRGNIFVPSKYVEEEHPYFMTWAQLKEICDNEDFSVAAHTHSHVDIRSLSEQEMAAEISQSTYLLRKHLGVETVSFCMPYGKYDVHSMALLKKLSPYKYIFTSFYGQGEEEKLDTKLLPRIGISNDDTIEIFQKKLQGDLNWKGIIQKVRLLVANIRGERITQYDIE